MNKLNSFLKHVFQMTFSNLITLIGGILSTFIIPHILSKTNFGYYKLFLLYATYVPLLHLGFVDGILLKNAGKSYDQLDTHKFRTYSKFFILFEIIISIIFSLIFLLMDINENYKIIFVSLGIYNIFLNVMTYYQFISKCILKFTQLARVTLFQSILNIFFIILSWLIFKIHLFEVNYGYYLFATTFVLFLIVLFYIFKYRDITFGLSNSLKSEKYNIFNYFKSGLLLTITYQVMNLMNNLDNQVIAILFKASLYGTYAFAYSMVSIVITLFGSVSAILFPYMKKDSKVNIINNHSTVVKTINMVIFFMLMGYFPLVIIIHLFLPQYIDSLNYLKVVFPGVVVNCVVGSIIFNSYIYFHKLWLFMKISLFNVLISLIIYLVAYYFTRSSMLISTLSILSMAIWYILLEIPFNKWFKIPIIKNYLYILIMMLGFIFSVLSSHFIIDIISYVVIYTVITYVFYHDDIKFIVNKYLNK